MWGRTMRKLLMFLVVVIMLVGCSEGNEKKVVVEEENSAEQLKANEGKGEITKEISNESEEESKSNIPNVIDEVIYWEWAAFKKIWGEPNHKVDNENGLGYQYKEIPGITFIPDENEIISSVVITNKDVDIYGTSVGQTPDEINKIMEIEPEYSGPNELDQWVLEHRVGETLWAYYTSAGEDKPVESILLYSAEPTIVEESVTESTNSQEPINVILNVSNIFQDLIKQWKVVVQITSLEQEPINNGTVTLKIYETDDPYGYNLGTTKTVEFNNVLPGETREYEIGADLLNQVAKVEIIDAVGE